MFADKLLHMNWTAKRQAAAKLRARGSRRSSHSGPASLATTISNKIQSYISASDDPYLNLSIEHHLLQTSPPDSTILFLYSNRPCVVIGRNQNPWVEVNFQALDPWSITAWRTEKNVSLDNIDLVRRRSGGGAVFHDEGNVNWSVICPPADFTRDKHAEMVVRALRKLGVDRARVNERHDIVLDQGKQKGNSDPQDTHRTAYMTDDGVGPQPLKVSGSAYKLTRNRALHHGTCLLNSPNLNVIGDILRSPAKPYLMARGVESVSSPVTNIGLGNEAFQKQVQEEFARMYSERKEKRTPSTVVDEKLLDSPDIRKGYEELRTVDWTYYQTPQFTVYSHPEVANDPEAPLQDHRDRTSILGCAPPETPTYFKIQHGAIVDFGHYNNSFAGSKILAALKDKKIHDLDMSTRYSILDDLERGKKQKDKYYVDEVTWLQEMLPTVDVEPESQTIKVKSF